MKTVSLPILIFIILSFQSIGFLFGAIPAQERAALIALYNSANGGGWTNNTGWKTPPLDTDGFAMPGTEGTWYGVSVENDYVNMIYMFDNHLSGTIPSQIGNFSHLQTLDLGWNNLSGTLPPQLGNLCQLLNLRLGWNESLSGTIPSELGNLSQLRDFHLCCNRLTGSIPSSLGNLSHLTRLDLGCSQLTGSIPPELGNLGNLQLLTITSTKVSGPIPKELANLSNLLQLCLGTNQLSGTIPPELGNLPNLQVLDLSLNQLRGSIPKELTHIDSLRYLYLSFNELSGSIPAELGNLSNLTELHLGHNQLSGSIPTQLGNLSQLTQLTLYSNLLTGSIPSEFLNLKNIRWLSIIHNCLSINVDAALRAWLDSQEKDWKQQDQCSLESKITVTQPNGGENWPGGEFAALGWASVGNVGSVKLEYTTDNGANWITIVSSTPDRGLYWWIIPNITSSKCKFRVTQVGTGTASDESDHTFSILSSLDCILTIKSRGLAGVPITVSPSDNNGKDNGFTNFIRYYKKGTSVTLTAPATVKNYHFVKWMMGSNVDTNATLSIPLTGNTEVTALYEANQVPPEISVSRKSLALSYILGSDTLPSETMTISNKGGGTLNWTLSTVNPPFTVTPTSGTGTGTVTVTIDPENLEAGKYTATCQISATGATNSPVTVNLTLTVKQLEDSSPPFGEFSTPTDNATLSGSIALTGWALDDTGIQSLKLYKEENGNLSYLGEAIFVEGSRPDIETAYPDIPGNYNAGWGYMLLTFLLPDGVYHLHAIATDKHGKETTVGIKTITVDNAHAVTPFGAIDTPGPGETVSGKEVVNFGWALTPQPNSIPVDGSTIDVAVDGVVIGHPVYNIFRSDIADLFPGYANTDGAIGYFYLDTRALTDGLHTLSWNVTDSAGNCTGIGSRYVSVTNGTTSESSSRESFSLSQQEELEGSYPEEGEAVTIEIRELERVEINLRDLFNREVSQGYLAVGDRLKPLPVGSTLDRSGVFYWQPGPGFIGAYRLVFIGKDNNGGDVKKNVTITIKAQNAR
ncbi:MAG: leucine-rich repeat domain-containing protein [Candidatus Omnitrophota bacterium]